MNKLKELIQEFCPNGVRFEKLNNVLTLQYGKGNTIPLISGDYPVYGSFGIVGTTNEFNNEDSPIIGHIGSAGQIIWGEGKHFVTYNGIISKSKPEFLLERYSYYLLLNLDLPKRLKGSQPFISYSDIYNIVAPIPPLTVQSEIVRILDNFTEFTTELTTEITTELTARIQQYEHYKNSLMKFNKEPIVSINEVCIATKNVKWKETSEEFYYIDLSSVDRKSNEIKPETIINSKNAPSRAQQIVKTDDVLFATTRPTLQRYCIIPSKYDNQICSTGFCVLRANTNLILPRFLYYIISTTEFNFYIENNQEGSSYPSISNQKVKNYGFQLPPLKEQQRIVDILDKFDKLVNDISEGLPAEIAARKKQYEYYRDKLLTFKEVGNESI